jgi:predicted TIM-barrel fold metal-dependent hydrolase
MANSGPVIDTHHHIWLRKDVAWLADPPIPRMFGYYFGIRRDYPVEEFINDAKPQGVYQVRACHGDVGTPARARRNPLASDNW